MKCGQNIARKHKFWENYCGKYTYKGNNHIEVYQILFCFNDWNFELRLLRSFHDYMGGQIMRSVPWVIQARIKQTPLVQSTRDRATACSPAGIHGIICNILGAVLEQLINCLILSQRRIVLFPPTTLNGLFLLTQNSYGRFSSDPHGASSADH